MNMPSDRPDHPDWGARADYPLLAFYDEDKHSLERLFGQALDEIDMLRRAVAIAILDKCRPVLEALEEYDRTGKMP